MPTVIQDTIADRVDGKPLPLLNAITAVTNGEWVKVGGVRPFSVIIRGTFTATCKVFISNDPTLPSNSDNAYPQLGGDKTAPALISLADAGVQWVKVQVSAYTDGTIYAAAMVG